MKKNEILNQYYKNITDKFSSIRVVKFYDRDEDNEICIVKLPNTNDPYTFMDTKSGMVFGRGFKTLHAIREYKLLKNSFFSHNLEQLKETRKCGFYTRLVSRYEEFKKIWGNR